MTRMFWEPFSEPIAPTEYACPLKGLFLISAHYRVTFHQRMDLQRTDRLVRFGHWGLIRFDYETLKRVKKTCPFSTS
jgi:hypothetical protein